MLIREFENECIGECDKCPHELNISEGFCRLIVNTPTIEAAPVENINRIMDRLKKELYLADKAKERCNSLQFDVAKGYATGIYNAIEFVKEELSTLDICEYKCNLD